MNGRAAPPVPPRYEALRHVSFSVATLGKCAKVGRPAGAGCQGRLDSGGSGQRVRLIPHARQTARPGSTV